MAVGATEAAGAATTSGNAAGLSKRTSIAQNFDSFLLLLTTQLKNQSPLDPLDTNQFTQQLVQFASVEQQLKSNETLGALLNSTKAATASTAASFVGRQVTADGATAPLADGKAQWTVSLPRAGQATLTIQDAKGSVVATRTQSMNGGNQTFTWDGRMSTGMIAPPGDYTLTVTGRDPSGQPMSIKTEITGQVTSVDLSGTEPVLLVGASRVPLSRVKGVGGS